MKTEKIVLSLIAILFGLFVAGLGFYIYESTKVIPKKAIRPFSLTLPSASPAITQTPVLLTISNPADESVVTNKTLMINGKTIPDGTILISAPSMDQVAVPSQTGDFSTTITLDNGENKILITAISPGGQETVKMITVTYSTENF